ncbi:MAG: hypothetical protein A3I11_00370 [Elusimicrobia bacterium RIFCSPLOWO2_02_FULL_39_32]|nr:MAG: hypothetical protein A2034_01755 [Elusimicrobia bacterium GWA2_38_7]OGR80816.1 MAG: hypothetical protein A3B80_09375 [Elusimicrobia bacterium RIFCSPHIGHO2_02_FULL_39_36]OGR93605.1 MAG: hypothetical protein A3I11_00370 [Elusimicrobia bacterium RIFCSPLOWO2_02_FULL_39_32]OGS00892.1 MAG: hypothetical protein A3G85_00215 [Elusimicrobia bacterium RIFCSPLOWO2_12_FULL_39_28]
MILYLDTSSLAKLYFEEEDSGLIQRHVRNSQIIFSSVITYPEFYSALSRRKREGALKTNDYKKTLSIFEQDWIKISKIPVTLELAASAGHLSDKHRLRGMDAVHLASACLLRDELKEDIHFLSSDKKQLQAASKENLVV